MRAGLMDRRIVIEQKTPARDSYGAETVTWGTFVTLWAQMMEGSVNERYAANSQRATRMVVFRARYYPNVTTEMRVNFDGKYYGIKGIKEIGRRAGMDLDTEYLQSAQEGL